MLDISFDEAVNTSSHRLTQSPSSKMIPQNLPTFDVLPDVMVSASALSSCKLKLTCLNPTEYTIV